MTVLFRPAQRGDAREIARFFQITSEGGADYIWSLIAQPGEDLLEVGAALEVQFYYKLKLLPR